MSSYTDLITQQVFSQSSGLFYVILGVHDQFRYKKSHVNNKMMIIIISNSSSFRPQFQIMADTRIVFFFLFPHVVVQG